jgi:hypothetical protein
LFYPLLFQLHIRKDNVKIKSGIARKEVDMFKKKPISNVPPLDKAVGDMYIPEINRAMALKLELIKSDRVPFIAEYEKEAEQFFSDIKKDISGRPLEKRSFYWFEILPEKYLEWSMQYRWGIWPPHFSQYFVDLPLEIKAGINLHNPGSRVMVTWQGIYAPSCQKRLDLQFICLGPCWYFGTVSESKAETGEGVPNGSGIYREERIPYDVYSNYITFITKLHRYQVPSTGYIEEFLAGVYPLSRLLEVMEKVSIRVAEFVLQKAQSHFKEQMDDELFQIYSFFQEQARIEKESNDNKKEFTKRLREMFLQFDL